MSVVTRQTLSMHWGLILAAPLALVGTALAVEARADEPAVWHESFDGPSVSWEAADHDAAYRVDQHARTAEGARSGQCESLQITSGATGTHILFLHHVGRARVMPELRPSLWIRSDRPGAGLMARAVLPEFPIRRRGVP